ncbi:MAG TPA: PD-(D/E)XK nuclease family protein [Candidatus Poseidoniaceae archaeon]|nr:PD-(D/E)XK nuclease family protein [Candidatus Poseidoniaceae archaeon]
MTEQSPSEPRPHMLSPSAWNRYETCPRMYWLSRQRLPRKAGMAASLGTAVHASVEDLLNLDISGRPDAESGWLPKEGERLLKLRWDEEKAIFDATPRRPKWKEEKWNEAIRNQRGAVMMLLDHVGVRSLEQEQITAALWRRIQKLTIAVEGELKTADGRLMGRLDLLMGDVNDAGELIGWLVADLKTGRIPEGKLKTDVNRQLRMYRDILLANNPNAPTVRTEGWYTQNASKWAAQGENVLEAAYAAWQETVPTPLPMKPTIGDASCGGFCDWKAWCPHWWNWRNDNGTLHREDFSDAVVLLQDYDANTGSAVLELCEPADVNGRAMPTGNRQSARFSDRGKEALEEVLATGHQGPIYLGSIMTQSRAWKIGHWCDVLPWNPLPDGVEYHRKQ